MTFRSIGELAFELLRELENGTERSAGKRAHPPVAPGEPGTEFVATSHVREGTQPVAFARRGEETRAQTVNGKKAGSRKAPRQLGGQEENPQTRTGRNWTVISASLMDIIRNKCAAAPQGSPTLAAHLFLVIDHDTAPKARKICSATKQQPTRNMPAVKP